jgi:hypothetical protein
MACAVWEQRCRPSRPGVFSLSYLEEWKGRNWEARRRESGRVETPWWPTGDVAVLWKRSTRLSDVRYSVESTKITSRG